MTPAYYPEERSANGEQAALSETAEKSGNAGESHE